MKDNARRIRTTKILRKPEIGRDDRETLKSLRRNWTCHRIPHTWEGTPPVFQLGYQGAFPLFFQNGERRPSQGER
jgi:hypothetical protein